MAGEQELKPGQQPPAQAAAASFANDLRALRRDAGQPSFRTMAKTVGSISHTTLYEAASGLRLPSWLTTRAFVRACGGDEEEWHRHWSVAVSGEPPAPLPPDPAPSAPPAAPHLADRQIWSHALSLLLGLALGACGTLGLVAVHTRRPTQSHAHN
ncbi:hypothetical protein [Kitasatospora sp. NPDC048407]|uniref:hypothetical protein n=1 Tax=Kitasatospora sp. NPDC048407 TaxID=3364051 RepID=UPI003714BE25